MKRLNIFSIIVFSLLAFVACTDENDHIKLDGDGSFTKPVLEQKVLQNFVVEPETVLSDSIGYWKWTKAEYNIQAPPSYNVQVDVSPSFETAQSLTTTADTYVKITYDLLNKAALRFVGAAQEITLYFRVKASLGTAEAGPVLYSETQQVTFTCRPSIKSVLYIVGDGLVGWGNNGKENVGGDLQLFFADQSSDADLKYTYTGVFKAGGMKFPTKAGNWDDAYAYKGGKLSPKNDGDNYTSAGAGLYTLSVDLKTLEVKMEAYTKTATVYDKMGMVGTAAIDWDNDTFMEQVADHVWVAKSVALKAGELKFRANGGWDSNWGAATKTEQDFPFGKTGGENIIIEEAGTYFVALNSLSENYIIIPVKDLP